MSCDRAGHLEGLSESSESGLYPLARREQFSQKPPSCLLSGFQRGPAQENLTRGAESGSLEQALQVVCMDAPG